MNVMVVVVEWRGRGRPGYSGGVGWRGLGRRSRSTANICNYSGENTGIDSNKVTLSTILCHHLRGYKTIFMNMSDSL